MTSGAKPFFVKAEVVSPAAPATWRAALPITLEAPGDMRAISTWTVKVDGEPVPDKVRFSQGALTLKVSGMEIKIR